MDTTSQTKLGPLRPPSTLLMGPAGTGKTTSLATLIKAGLKLRMLATEPSAPSRVLGRLAELGLSAEGFDWNFVQPAAASWDSLISSAEAVNAFTIKQLADMTGGIAKKDSNNWILFLRAMNNFVSAKTGEHFGDIASWGDDVAFVIDGLTGVNQMSRMLTVGLKPNPNPGEWGIMQGNIYSVLNKLCADLHCFFVCIAHVERENNELTGVANITVSTLGAKLAPRLPPLFTNVILAERKGKSFNWSTETMNVDTKNGDLPIAPDLQPSFELIVDTYRRQLKAASAPPQALATPLEAQTVKP